MKSKKGRKFLWMQQLSGMHFPFLEQTYGDKCIHCGDAMVERMTVSHGVQIVCQNSECKHRQEVNV